MFANPLMDGAPCFPDVGGPTRTRDQVDTLHVLRVNGSFHRSEGITNRVEGSKRRGDIIPLKDSSNLVRGSLDIGKVDPYTAFLRLFFNSCIPRCFKESLLT